MEWIRGNRAEDLSHITPKRRAWVASGNGRRTTLWPSGRLSAVSGTSATPRPRSTIMAMATSELSSKRSNGVMRAARR